MNDNEIIEFISAYQDFMKHAEIEEIRYNHREEAKQYTEMFIEQKAAELEITVDYYIQEFM